MFSLIKELQLNNQQIKNSNQSRKSYLYFPLMLIHQLA